MPDDPKWRQHLKLAFKALLAGDTGERDRQCELARIAGEEEQRTLALSPGDPLSTN